MQDYQDYVEMTVADVLKNPNLVRRVNTISFEMAKAHNILREGGIECVVELLEKSNFELRRIGLSVRPERV